MQKKTYQFTGVVEEVNYHMTHTAVFLPHHIIIELPKGRSKVSGTMNGAPFSVSIQSRRDGSKYFSISSPLAAAALVAPGDAVKVVFQLFDPYRVEIPESFENVLKVDEQPQRHYRKITSLKHRNLEHYFEAAKGFDSRIRKSFEVIQRAKAASLESVKNKKRKNDRQN
jgi:hypothetical protein